jgi:hypothetical protein
LLAFNVRALKQESKKDFPSGLVQEHLCCENSSSEENIRKQKQQRSLITCASSLGSMTGV